MLIRSQNKNVNYLALSTLVSVLFVMHAKRFMGGAIPRCELTRLANRHRYRIPLLKLTINVGTLAILHLPLTFVGILLVFGSDGFWHETFPCFIVSNIQLVRIIASVVQLLFMLRILIDPIICFVIDKEVNILFKLVV